MADLYRPSSSGVPSWDGYSGTYLPTAYNVTKKGSPPVGDNDMEMTMKSPKLHKLVNRRYYHIATGVDAMTGPVGVSTCAPV
jgi:hypothetical protein